MTASAPATSLPAPSTLPATDLYQSLADILGEILDAGYQPADGMFSVERGERFPIWVSAGRVATVAARLDAQIASAPTEQAKLGFSGLKAMLAGLAQPGQGAVALRVRPSAWLAGTPSRYEVQIGSWTVPCWQFPNGCWFQVATLTINC